MIRIAEKNRDRGTPLTSSTLRSVAQPGREASARAIVAACVLAVLAGCATVPPGTRTPVPSGPDAAPAAAAGAMARGEVLRSLAIDADLENRILALDPEHIGDSDVRGTLALGPTPRVILLHGGIYPVHLMMKSFSIFLERMGYPTDKLRDPADGAYSQSPYGDSDRLTGEIAWYYEHDGVRPMMVGHSQGGVQAVKILYELGGAFGDRVAVWNPVKDVSEARFSITDPLTGETRSVVGLSVAYVSAVGAGGAALALPNQWGMAGRMRNIPETVDEFTGYTIPGDLIAWTFPGASGATIYRHNSAAKVRNATLPDSYHHITVPLTSSLANDASARAWINAYQPSGGEDEVLKAPTDVKGDNIVWAADVWFSIKKHWCLEEQRLIRARRAALAAR
jgi:hypothetical protein